MKISFFGSLVFYFIFSLFPSVFASDNDNFIYRSSEGEVILNGKSLGYGTNLVVFDDAYAFEQMKDDGVHVVYNGKDQGLGNHPQLTDGKLLYETEKNLLNTIVFDGKNYGEGFDPRVQDGHFLYFQKIRGENLRKIDQGAILVFYDGKYYCDGKDDSIKTKVFMAGDNVVCEQEITKKDATKSFVVFNGKVIAEGEVPNVSKTHYAFTQEQDLDGVKFNVIFFDGKNIGEGSDFQFSDESFMYLKKNLEGKDEIIFNGKNIGSFNSIDTVFFVDGHIVFYRDIIEHIRSETTGVITDTAISHLFFDGIDYGRADAPTLTGAGKKIYLSGGHVAFERTLKGTKYDETGKVSTVDVTYLVFDGRERTQIQAGTLRMEDGTFAFSRKKNVYDSELLSGKKDSSGNDILGKWIDKDYIYKGSPDGTYKELGEGDPLTIIVQDGRVGYLKPEKEDRNIMVEGISKTVEIPVNALMLDGVKKGIGDIATLVMDKGQYAFAENKMGRFILTVNAKQQSFPGMEVQFLGKKQESTKSKKASETVVSGPELISGKLMKRGGKYFILSTKDKKYYYIIPSKTQKIETFLNKNIFTKVERKIYQDTKSKQKFYAYKLLAFSAKAFTDNSVTYKGSLTRTGTTYSLRVGTKDYKLNIKAPLVNTDLEPYIDTVVTLKLKKNGSEWDVAAMPK